MKTAPIVIKLGGALLDNPGTNAPFFQALAEFIQQDQSVVLVHGGGKSVDRHLELLGHKSEKREGIRITPPEQMREIAGVPARARREHRGAYACRWRHNHRAQNPKICI